MDSKQSKEEPVSRLFPYKVETPWPKPRLEDCLFYHALDLADGTSIDGAWDIGGNFENYIGDYNVRGKTLLDVGTASGYLAFEAEKAGATVTATDAFASPELERLPFKRSLHHRDRTSWSEHTEQWFRNLKNGFWYAWHANKSKIDVIYAPLDRLPYWNRKFDIVLAGAIFEHLANPIVVLGNLAGLANEAVIIAFTPVGDTDAQIMETANDWSSTEDSQSPDDQFGRQLTGTITNFTVSAYRSLHFATMSGDLSVMTKAAAR